jgi:hypothetical protein
VSPPFGAPLQFKVTMIDRDRFFAKARALDDEHQVDDCNAILDGWERRANIDKRRFAYTLATAKWRPDIPCCPWRRLVTVPAAPVASPIP